MSSFRGRHAELLQRIDDVWNGGDVAAIRDLYADDFKVNGEQLGPEGVEGFLLSLRAAFPDMSFDLTHQLTEGEVVALRFVQRGTHSGTWESPLGTLEPTGKRFEIGGIEIFRIVGGKAAEVWIEYDLLGLLQQLGALTPR
jgi:predicted ester cyclase